MAFANLVWFRAASAGAGDFVPASAITGYLVPASASMVDGASYSYVAFSDDQSQKAYGSGTWHSGTNTLQRSGSEQFIGAGFAGAFSAAPQVMLTPLASDLIGGSTVPDYFASEETVDLSAAGTINPNVFHHKIITNGSAGANTLDFPSGFHKFSVITLTDPADYVTFSTQVTARTDGLDVHMTDVSEAMVVWTNLYVMLVDGGGNCLRGGTNSDGSVALWAISPLEWSTVSVTTGSGSAGIYATSEGSYQITSGGTAGTENLALQINGSTAFPRAIRIEFASRTNAADRINLTASASFKIPGDDGAVVSSVVLNNSGDYVDLIVDTSSMVILSASAGVVTYASGKIGEKYVSLAGFPAETSLIETDSAVTVLDISQTAFEPVNLSGCTSLQQLYANTMSNLTTTLLVSGSPSLSIVTTNGSEQLIDVEITGAALIEAVVDLMLDNLDVAGLSGGTVDLSGGTSSAPSAAGLVSKANLIGKGWTVTTN